MRYSSNNHSWALAIVLKFLLFYAKGYFFHFLVSEIDKVGYFNWLGLMEDYFYSKIDLEVTTLRNREPQLPSSASQDWHHA